MDYNYLLNEAEQYVRSYFSSHNNQDLVYHNLNHTRKVVKAAEEIADALEVPEKDFAALLIAAWFHDTGHYIKSEEHESHSVTVAVEFLKKMAVDEGMIAAVTGCIMATRMPQRPENWLEEIICDADLYDLGTDSFWENNRLLLKEAQKQGKNISKEDWDKGTIALLEHHHYFTDYCQKKLNEKKVSNLLSVKDKNKLK